MRTIAPFCVLAALCTLAAQPAQAQQVERIKASGANAAGACAGSLEMAGQYLSRAQTPDPRKLADIQQGRDFFADLSMYPTAEIAAAANAFIAFMSDRLGKATTQGERQAIEREIIGVSSKCMQSAKATITASRNAAGASSPAIAGTVQPSVAPPATVLQTPTIRPYVPQPPATQPYVVQPSTVQPSTVQPSTVQPYSTQPLLLDPVVPSR